MFFYPQDWNCFKLFIVSDGN